MLNRARYFSSLLLGFVLTLTSVSPAALPKIALQPAFPDLTFDRPLWMTELPDGSGRYFILEQAGRIISVQKNIGGSNTTEILNLVDRKPDASNEEGFLGLALHPRFSANGLFYLSYNQQNPRRSVLSEFKLAATDSNRADVASERILLEVPQPYWNHKGGQVSFGPDGFLYFSLGDGGAANDPHHNGQNPESLLGKILRLDINSRSTNGTGPKKVPLAYGIPSDNPFVGEIEKYGVRKEIWAYGLRNVWRFSWDRKTGELWAGDVGQDDWEEVDLIVKGGNYGWSVREGMHPFTPGPKGARFVEPVLEYPHRPDLLTQSKFPKHGTGLSITGGYVYRGRKYPALRGVYVYADYALGTIFGLRRQQHRVVEYGKLLSQPKNIVSFAEDLAGELYVLTLDGKIFTLTVPSVR